MKKISFLVCVAFIALTQVVNAAQPTSPLVASKTANVPSINVDGIGNAAWNATPWQPIGVVYTGETAGFGDKGSSPTDDLTAKFKILFDDTNVYFLFDVIDDFVCQEGTPDFHWAGDKVEVYFGLAGYDPFAGAAADHSRQFAIKAQIDPTSLGQNGSANYKPASDALETDGVDYSYVETATGYIMQLTINKAIALESMPEGSTVAFDVCIADNDEGQGIKPAKRYRKSWFNDGAISELWASMYFAGQLTLGTASGINEIAQNVSFTILNNELTLLTDNNVNVNVFDITGKSLISVKNTKVVYLKNLNAGIYLGQVQEGNVLKNFRFIKK